MNIPDDYGMFSDEGNKRVKEAVLNTLHHIENLEWNEATGEKLNTLAYRRLERIQDDHKEALDTAVREAYFITLDKIFYKYYGVDGAIFTALTNEELEEWTD